MAADELVSIWILDREFAVPGDETLMRAFQYLRMRAVASGGFCWSSECFACEVEVVAGGSRERVFACQTRVTPGMRVVDLSASLRVALGELLGPAPGSPGSRG